MRSIKTADYVQGVSLRQAAVIAGLGYLMPVSYAEFSVWPRLVIPGNIEQTVHNIAAHPRALCRRVGLGWVATSLRP